MASDPESMSGAVRERETRFWLRMIIFQSVAKAYSILWNYYGVWDTTETTFCCCCCNLQSGTLFPGGSRRKEECFPWLSREQKCLNAGYCCCWTCCFVYKTTAIRCLVSLLPLSGKKKKKQKTNKRKKEKCTFSVYVIECFVRVKTSWLFAPKKEILLWQNFASFRLM